MLTSTLTTSVLWLISATASAAYAAAFAAEGPSPAKTALKALPVAALAVLGVLFGAPAAIVAGLALGALGDAALSRPGPRAFLGGMAAFALGHLLYASAMLRPEGLREALPWVVPLLLLALSTEFWLRPRTGVLAWPVRGYVVLMTALGVAALTVGGNGFLLTGVGLFLASDLLLAVDVFVLGERRRGKLLPRVVWVSYWLGQILILLGSVLLVAAE